MPENIEEKQYLTLVKDVINDGYLEETRNGMTKMLFGKTMEYSLKNNVIPIFTTKRVAWKTCLKELLWFINGSTDNKILNAQNVHIWDKNGTQEFLKSRGIYDYQDGDLGPIYGFQWRHFNAKYEGCDKDYSGMGIDQLKQVIEDLKNPDTRNSRRHIVSAWNPCQLNEMALPPCHVLMQFQVVNKDELMCMLYQRSGDIGLGVPFNVTSYSFLTHIIAKLTGLKASKFVHVIGNAHIYDDHIECLREQVKREPYVFPTLDISDELNSIDSISFEHFQVNDYKYHPKIVMEMRT